MASSLPLQIAETIQTAHIRRDPSPGHDAAPSTAADSHEPVHLGDAATPSPAPASAPAPQRQYHSHSHGRHHRHHHHHHSSSGDEADLDSLDDDDDSALQDRGRGRGRRRGTAGSAGREDDLDDVDDEDIPYSVIKRPAARRPHKPSLPPLPDLRFEQSYLHSLAGADTWWKVAWITVRDQVMMPLLQGVLYNLAVCGWHFWNKNAQLGGSSAGARLRRWWYGVNNWPIPPEKLRPRRA